MTLKADAWFHDFRRTAIRNLERMGIPRSVAKLIVGHKTDSVYERYNVASKRDLDVALREDGTQRDGTSLFSFESCLKFTPPIRITLPVTGKVWAKGSRFWALPTLKNLLSCRK